MTPYLPQEESTSSATFFNDQISLDHIPSMATLEYMGMERNMLKADLIYTALFFAMGFIVLAILYYFEIEWVVTYGLYVAMLIITLLMISMAYTYKEFFQRSYAIRSRDIVYNKGLFWKSTIAIPFNRVQHCEVSQGPLDRYFDIAQLKIYTAGGSSSDLTIEGLLPETAQRIKNFIVAKTGIDEEE